MYENKTLVCKECGAEFDFTVQEQEFFAEKGFTNEPARCADCRAARKNYGRRQPREMHPAICSACGKETEVPFKPSGDKPVYCSECYSKNK